MKGVLIGAGVGLTIVGGGRWSMHRYMKHRNAAFCGILYETWDSPERHNTRPWENERVREYMRYRDSNFFHVVWYKPPYDAAESLEGVDAHKYSSQMLERCKSEAADLVGEMEQDLKEQQ